MVQLFGMELKVRGCNKKHIKLDNLDWLYDQLLQKSMGQLAKEEGIPYNSIRHRVYKYFTQEMRDKIMRERSFHTKLKSYKDI